MRKELDPQDPLELVGVGLPEGSSDLALEEIAQEYLFMGWKPLQILHLFRSPHYGLTHRIYLEKGEAHVKGCIQRLANEWSRGWLEGGSSA